MSQSVEQTDCPECGQIVHYQPQRWKAQVVCSNCQHTFAVEAATPPVPVADGSPIPSHLQGGASPAPTPTDAPADEPSTFRYRRSKVGGNLFAIFLVLAVVGVIGGSITLLVMLDRQSDQRQADADKEAKKNKTAPQEDIQYLKAGKQKGRVANVEVGINRVEYSPLTVKDQNNTVHQSDNMVIQVILDIRSRREKATPYQSPYGWEFKRGTENVTATLTDDQGTVLNMPVYEGVANVQWHTKTATLEKNDRISDCLIFELPEGRKITDIKSLKFHLPMECVGSNATLFFNIPGESIKLISSD